MGFAVVGRDPVRAGNRGSHRYSFGSSPAHFGLFDYWATMIGPILLTFSSLFRHVWP